MKSLEALLGDPREVVKGLEDFGKSEALLSSSEPRMADRYPDEWIGLYAGEVRAHEPTLDAVLTELDSLGLPHEGVLVRYIAKNPETLIL